MEIAIKLGGILYRELFIASEKNRKRNFLNFYNNFLVMTVTKERKLQPDAGT